jgi:predicted kinase
LFSDYASRVLISLSGLPGVGKTAIAGELARQLEAIHLRIDSIEQAIRDSAIVPSSRELDDAGYRAAYAVAEDNLKLGHSVVADCVNPIPLTRTAWREVAERSGVDCIDVEIICSNQVEPRRRVETRPATVRGLILPTWQEVIDRDYVAWEGERIVIDTAHGTIAQGVARLREAIRGPLRVV